MNLHVDEVKFQSLNTAPNVARCRFGSYLYKLADEHSDTDLMIIYFPFLNQRNNPFINHHTFQYKDELNRIDYVFVDVVTFIKNCCSGDSVTNFELVWSGAFKHTALEALYDWRAEFITYKLIKAYLGNARKDLKYLHKRKTAHDKKRGESHILRSLTFAQRLMEGHFDLKFERPNHFDFNAAQEQERLLREQLNQMNLPRFLSIDTQSKISDLLLTLDFNCNQASIDLADVYKTNIEHEIQYD